ncbi:MAG: hypothetical protein GXP44_02070 [bacterium]|nr:hypothetical protein [bacterium]
MKKLFLDIETLPADESKLGVLKEIYDYKVSKGKKVEESFEEYAEKTNFDGAFGRILCISVAVNDEPPQCLSGDEADILREFWDIAEDTNLFIGHNIFDFDLKFIFQRSIILKVKPSRNSKDLSFARYRNYPIYDIMYEWSKWSMQNKIALDTLAKALGVKSSKDGGVDGSKVHQYFKEGRTQEIYDYCNADVETTRDIFKRMTFED